MSTSHENTGPDGKFKTRILVADDDPRTLAMLARFLEVEGHEVTTASDGEEAINVFEKSTYDLVITDLKMPKKDGIEVLKEIKSIQPKSMGIVITGFASIDSAVEAMKVGAFDYVSKPIQFDEIRIVINRALEYQRLQDENFNLKKQLKRKYRFESIIGDHPKMQEVFKLIEKVADSDSTVLVHGASGTGKELVARAIHHNSPRRDRFLVPVNCGAIPENLLESELFGHIKGAFTGATTNRIGRFEAANGGTIFLDEIGDMSPNLQVKILRVLQEHEFEPVGSTRTRKVDVRVIAATNQDLEQAVAKKRFREDLYYRLNVIPIHLPTLKDRASDIPLLINNFIKRFSRKSNRNITMENGVVDVLMRYDWPGNVRELENLIERLVILNEKGVIKVEDLPIKFRSGSQVVANLDQEFVFPDNGIDFNGVVGEFEDKLIIAALQRSGGNKNLAAKMLGLKRTTLVEKIKKKGLQLDSLQEAS